MRVKESVAPCENAPLRDIFGEHPHFPLAERNLAMHLHTSRLWSVHLFSAVWTNLGRSEHPSAPDEEYDQGNNREGYKRPPVGFVKCSDYDWDLGLVDCKWPGIKFHLNDHCTI